MIEAITSPVKENVSVCPVSARNGAPIGPYGPRRSEQVEPEHGRRQDEGQGGRRFDDDPRARPRPREPPGERRAEQQEDRDGNESETDREPDRAQIGDHGTS